MASNKVYEYHSPIQVNVLAFITVGPPATSSFAFDSAPFVVIGTPNQAFGGNPVGVAMVGNENAVSPTGGFTGFVSADAWGAFALTVLAQSAESPAVNSKVVPGDKIYANVNTGTRTTNADGTSIFTGFTLDKNPSGIYFGYVVPGSPTVASGASGTAWVMIKGGAEQ